MRLIMNCYRYHFASDKAKFLAPYLSFVSDNIVFVCFLFLASDSANFLLGDLCCLCFLAIELPM